MLPSLTAAPTTTLVLAPSLAPTTTIGPAAEVLPATVTRPRTRNQAPAGPEPASATVTSAATAAPTPPRADEAASDFGVAAAPAASPPPANAATSVRQGGDLTFAVPGECVDPQFGTLDPGNMVIVDADIDPLTFTVQTGNLALGSYVLNVECENALSVQSELMVFRQNGAKRGGAVSMVTAGSIGLGSAVALVGLPGSFGGRRRRRSLWPPSANR